MVMVIFEYLVYISSFCALLAAVLYIRSMIKGKARPNRVTWLMWSVAPLIATAAEFTSKVGLAILPVFMNGFCPLLIFVASFFVKKAYWKLTRFDYACGTLSILALILWILTGAPNIAILFAIASDALGTAPTVKKAWIKPKSESFEPYAVGIFSAATAFGVISTWAFAAYAFPAYLIFINVSILSGLLIQQK
jgi:hypothetical protein